MVYHNPWFTAGMAGVLRPGANAGQILYVDTAANGGVDTNDGTTPSQPKLSIDGALTDCTDAGFDTIVVLNHDNANCPEWPINIDKDNVTIVAVPSGGWQPRYTGGSIIDPTGDDHCMTMEALHTRIIGFEFRPPATRAGIYFASTDCVRPGIFDCQFTQGAYGIWSIGDNMPGSGLEIARCQFTQNTTTSILHNNTAAFMWIHDCHFDRAVLGISLTGVNTIATRITDNGFTLAADVAGSAITLGVSILQVWVDGNSAVYGETAVAKNNPYLDNAAADANYWGRNYWGEVVTVPG